jgi:hypothetical protein
MPLSWFLSLERPDNEEMFLADGLARFGYLPNAKSSVNPDGLPVGFTEDRNGGTWVGLTCAACHTSQIEYHGAVIRIDGGPTSADIYAFLAELSAALGSTLNDQVKFARFALKAGANDPKAKRDLRNQLTRFTAYFSTFVDASTPDSPWGPARADAFGMIFNRVAAIDLADKPYWEWFQSIEENYGVPDAPVSYPFLWGTSRLDFVQWNAVAENRHRYQRLGRNIGEALGVFARINLRKPSSPLLGYSSSVNPTNQSDIEENLIHSLKSPQWPVSIIGGIDPSKATKGAQLYQQYCAACHQLVQRSGTTLVAVKKIPLQEVGTDPDMAVNVACRTANTGALVGTKQPPAVGHKLAQSDFVLNLVSNVVVGVEGAWLIGSASHKASANSASGAATVKTFELPQNVPIPFRISAAPQGNCMQDLAAC